MSDTAYSQGYIAATEIDINGVRAFNEGTPVPDQHVEKGIVSRDAVKAHKLKADQKPSNPA